MPPIHFFTLIRTLLLYNYAKALVHHPLKVELSRFLVAQYFFDFRFINLFFVSHLSHVSSLLRHFVQPTLTLKLTVLLVTKSTIYVAKLVDYLHNLIRFLNLASIQGIQILRRKALTQSRCLLLNLTSLLR